MTKRIILTAFLLAGAAVLSVGGPANAASNATMTACFEQWQSAKDAGTVPKGEIWTKYYSECAARMKKNAGANATDTTASKKKAKVGTATAPDTTTPVKKTKKTAAVKPPPAATDTPNYIPQEPTANDQAATASTTDAQGKPLSAGEVAFRKRIHECGVEWRQDKAKGTLPTGEQWPHFWSACNTRLKTQG